MSWFQINKFKGNLADASQGDTEMAVLIGHFGLTRAQPGGIESHQMINPGDALIKWQT